MDKDNKLNSKVYDLVEELETQQIDDNDTGQLADILNDYMTDLQPNFTQDLVTEEIDDLQIENNNEIDITVDEREILKQENEDLTLIGNETMLNLHLQDEALRQDLQSTTTHESNDFFEQDLLGENDQAHEENEETVKQPTSVLDQEEVSDSIDLEDLTNEFTSDNLENFNDEVLDNEEQTELDLAILALSQKVKEVKANPEKFTQQTSSSELEVLEDENEEEFSVTQTLISPTVMDIDSSDLTQEAELVETTNTEFLDNIEENQPEEVIAVEEVKDTKDKWRQVDQTIDLENFEKQNKNKEDLRDTIDLDALTNEEEAEFTKEQNHDSKKSTRKFQLFDWFLVVVIVVLTFILIKMLLNR